MSQSHSMSPAPVVVEAFVITAMALSTLALGTALYLHGGFSMVASLIASLAAYAAMLMMHGAVRGFLLGRGAARKAEVVPPASPVRKRVQGAAGEPGRSAGADPSRPDGRDGRAAPGADAPSMRLPSEDAQAGGAPVQVAPVQDKAVQDKAVLGERAFENRQDGLPASEKPTVPMFVKPGSEAPDHARVVRRPDDPVRNEADQASAFLQTSPRPADVEVIRALIKKLADEVNAGEALNAGTPRPEDTKQPQRPDGRDQIGSAASGAEPPEGGLPHVMAKPSQPGRQGRAAFDDPADTTVPALTTAGSTMRGMDQRARIESDLDGLASRAGPERAGSKATQGFRPDFGPGSGAGSQAGSWDDVEDAGRASASQTGGPAAAQGEDGTHADAVCSAIRDGRVDILLDPIIGLDGPQTRHFELEVRLRDEAGGEIRVSDGRSGGASAYLLSLLDRTRVVKSEEIGRQLATRNKSTSLFSKTTAHSLTEDEFLDQFADTYRSREQFASQLIMSFSQSEVRRFGTREWSTLSDMSELGFRFAIGSVSDLEMDFEDLSRRGFVFVKLDAEVFLSGLPAGSDLIPTADICKFLSALGMTLIVGRIDDAETHAKVFGFGALLGQGELFGGARLVKPEALAGGAAGRRSTAA